MEVKLTQAALDELNRFFETKDKSPVRIFLQPGCGGAILRLALDEAGENDDTCEVEGITFLIDKAMTEMVMPVDVDFGEMGFTVKSDKLGEMGGSCCSGCSGCS